MQFSSTQRNLAIRAMNEAEDHTARYYCIPPFRWELLRYDLVTRQDREWEPIPDDALARLQCLEFLSSRSNRTFDFYRIQLNDARILQVAERESLGRDLYPLLVFILTHELVHLVRLSSILHPFPAVSKDQEENRVHRISGRILAGASLSRFKSVLDRFGDFN